MDRGLIIHTVIYNNDRKVLIIKRSKTNDVLPEYWDVPGGTLEDGEDPVAGAIPKQKRKPIWISKIQDYSSSARMLILQRISSLSHSFLRRSTRAGR